MNDGLHLKTNFDFQKLFNSDKSNIHMNGLNSDNPDYDNLNMKITIILQLLI